MNVREYLVTKIYDLCQENLDNIPREEWEQLNNNVSQYLEEHDINQEGDLDFQEIFCLKPDEREQLTRVINNVLGQYPLVETFFLNNREMNLPQLDMMGIIQDWCKDFVEFNEEMERDEDEEEEMERDEDEEEEIEENVENLNEDEEEYLSQSDIEVDIANDYITVKYFQGLFLAIYSMFMDREL
jgi:lysyl-tRNA synthetase class I